MLGIWRVFSPRSMPSPRVSSTKERLLAQFILLDQFHIDVTTSSGPPENEYLAMKRILDDLRFRLNLRWAIRDALQLFPIPSQTRIRLFGC